MNRTRSYLNPITSPSLNVVGLMGCADEPSCAPPDADDEADEEESDVGILRCCCHWRLQCDLGCVNASVHTDMHSIACMMSAMVYREFIVIQSALYTIVW